MILGINAFHADASAAALLDGEIVAAVEEERLNRVKHASGFPAESIRWVLETANADINDIRHIALSRSPHVHRARRLTQGLLVASRARALPRSSLRSRGRVLGIRAAVEEALGAKLDDRCTVHYVEHHPSHIASSFFAGPFEEAAVCSVDGLGDVTSMAWGNGKGTELSIAGRVFFPHSLGFFYTAVTQHLGFHQYGDEYKVMGLAPYGEPRYLPEMRKLVSAGKMRFRLALKYFRHPSTWDISSFDGDVPSIEPMFGSRIDALIGPPRPENAPLTTHHLDLAASAQARLEEVLLPVFDGLQQRTGLRALALAGGVALNVTLNSRIAEETGFDDVFIQPAANDAGTSIGAALYVAHEKLGWRRQFRMDHTYLGPAFSTDECRIALEEAGLPFTELIGAQLYERTAELLAGGKIVGWFQGRMEFGPRALGNRSILCDPRRPEMKDTLNATTKRRESFRPFAPAILAERSGDVYEFSGSSPFMLFAPRVRPEWAARVPAVTHVDGTGRIQTVDSEGNPRFWSLLREFDRITGVPVLLNTSFNESEPIVCTPAEAISCYLRAKMDVLVLDRFIVAR